MNIVLILSPVHLLPGYFAPTDHSYFDDRARIYALKVTLVELKQQAVLLVNHLTYELFPDLIFFQIHQRKMLPYQFFIKFSFPVHFFE